jgi:hypothetical protein
MECTWCLKLSQIMTYEFGTFFGMTSSHNNINMLQRSPVFARLVEGHAPPCNYEINHHLYINGYYLVEGIYSKWSIFVNTISYYVG